MRFWNPWVPWILSTKKNPKKNQFQACHQVWSFLRKTNDVCFKVPCFFILLKVIPITQSILHWLCNIRFLFIAVCRTPMWSTQHFFFIFYFLFVGLHFILRNFKVRRSGKNRSKNWTWPQNVPIVRSSVITFFISDIQCDFR